MSNRFTGKGEGMVGLTGIKTLNLTTAAAGRHYYLHFQMRKLRFLKRVSPLLQVLLLASE